MYGIGLSELFVIFLVLLLFFNPSEIFSLFRKAGSIYRKILRFEDQVKKEILSETTDTTEKFVFDIDDKNEKGDKQ